MISDPIFPKGHDKTTDKFWEIKALILASDKAGDREARYLHERINEIFKGL